MGALSLLGGAAGAHEAIQDLLAQRALEQWRQQQLAEETRSNKAREAIQAEEAASLAAWRQHQMQPKPDLRVVTTPGPDGNPLTKAVPIEQLLSGIPAYRAPEKPELTPAEREERAYRETRGRQRALAQYRRPVRGPQLGMPADYFKAIQTLPRAGLPIETAIQNALESAPPGTDPQRVVQVVREAYGMTARPTVTEQQGPLARARALKDSRLQALKAEFDADPDYSPEQYASDIQAALDEYMQVLNGQ